MSKFCKSCGAQPNPGAKFCGSCRAVVPATAIPAQVAPASPAPAGIKNTAAKRQGLPPTKILITLIAAVLVLALGIGILPGLLGVGGKYSFEKGGIRGTRYPNG